LNKVWMDLVNEKLELILEEAIFDPRSESIFKLHYGVQCARQEPKTISKQLKISQKKLKIEIDRIDNKVFNILKKHQLFSETNM
jgi:hypothetical protein